MTVLETRRTTRQPIHATNHAKTSAALGLIGVLVVAIGTPVLAMLVVPRHSSSVNWVNVASVQQVPSNGKPELFPVTVMRQDAWTMRPHDIGFVYLRRTAESGTVAALRNISPRLGARVRYDDDLQQFRCTCHGGENYDLDGRRIGANPAPRDLDKFDVSVSGDAVYVHWQVYRIGVPNKVAVP